MFGAEVRILLIEDSYVSRVELRKILEELGYMDVTEAKNGAEAVEKLIRADSSGHPLQLIVSDWQMPEMDGLELLKMIKSKENWADIPFLFVTSRASLQDVYTAAAAGVEHYVVKPIKKEQLKSKIEALYRNALSKFAKVATEALIDAADPTKDKKQKKS